MRKKRKAPNDPRRRPRGREVTDEDLRKKDFYYTKKLKQGVKQAAKLEAGKILRRIREAKESGSDGDAAAAEKLRSLESQLERARGLDAEGLAESLSKGEVIDDVVGQRIARQKCVRDVQSEWAASLEKLRKQIEKQQQQKLQRDRDGDDGAADRAESEGGKSGKPPSVVAKDLEARPKKKTIDKKPPKPKHQPQKKRMGQRARRLLAEKQYGWQAKHLQVTPTEDHPYWKSILAKEGGEGGKAGGGGGSADRDQGDKGSARASGSGAGASNGVHPSWEAKRLAKKKLDLVGKEKGKKIVFE